MTHKSRTFVAYFVPVIVLAIAALVIVFVHEERRARSATEAREGQLVAVAAAVIRARLEVPKQDLLYLSELQDVGQLLGGDSSARTRVGSDFEAFVKEHRDYGQLRILDASGREIVRVDRTPTGARLVPSQDLQQKGNRYYFREAIRDGWGQVYVSPLDLNVEHGQVERPPKPTMRFATPLYDSLGVKRGVLVLNVLAAPILQELRQLGRSSRGRFWLVNRDGYPLLAPSAHDEFGFMFPGSGANSLAVLAPQLWSWLRAHSAASGVVGDALVTELRLCGKDADCGPGSASEGLAARRLPFTAPDQPWTVFTKVTPGVFYAGGLLAWHYLPIYAVFAILALIAALSGRAASKLSTALRTLRHREQALRESEQLFREFAGNIPEAFWVREVGSDSILYASPAWTQITGKAQVGTLSEMLSLVHPDDHQRAVEAARAGRHGGLDSDLRIVRPDQSVRWLHVRTFPIRDQAGTVYRVAGVAEDVTQYKEAQERILQIARYDHLTDLPNRSFFYESLKRILAHDAQGVVGILFIDLDRFKLVNDSLGHAMGDKLLQQVASRLLSCVRTRDVVGRLGGDEFAIVLPLLQRADHAGGVAAKVLGALSTPFVLEEQEVYISASIGITVYPGDSTDADELLRFADAAMYRAKDDGRSTYRYYTAEMNAQAAEKLELETSLRGALGRNEFVLHYQPKLDLESGEVSGLEALLRWNRTGVGPVSPAQFIPLLEESGMIVPVGEWVIQEVCSQLKVWQADGVKPVPVAVNLSGRQFQQKDLAATITHLAREQGIVADLLHCEITESLLMSNVEQAIATLKALQSAGIQIAVDDFGTGYSSLSYLKRFPINALKIDQSFVRDITTNPDDAAIATAIIQLAHNLGLKVIAEGVETAEQLQFLRLSRCDEMQGYFLSRPVDSAAIARLLREHDAANHRV